MVDARAMAALETLRCELEESGLMGLLDDPATTDVMVNPESVFAAGVGRGAYDTGLVVEANRLESMIASLAGLHGLVVDRDQPILEADLPFHGVRVQAVLPPVVTSPVLALRKPAVSTPTLDEMVANGSVPEEVAPRLRQAVLDRETMLIAGGVGSGKTTLLSALLGELLKERPEERVVVCEEGCRELVVPGANTVRLLASEEAGVSLARLLRCALRMNPDRIVVGEARGAEALDFLRACNTGHRGAMMTLHANSAEDALYRLDDLVQEAGVGSQMGRIRSSVARVVFMQREGTVPTVAEVLRVAGAARAHAPVGPV